MKRVFWCAAAAALAVVFWACGDGAVEARVGDDDMALLNYGPPFVEGDTGNMWTLRNQAISDCEADESCKAAMERASGNIEGFEESSSSVAAAVEESSSSAKPKSSGAVVVPLSSVAQVISEVTSSSGGAASVPTSSAGTTIQSSTTVSGVTLKYCLPEPTTVVKGEPVTWKFRTNGAAPSSYQWSFTGGDIETSTEESPVVTFTSAGSYAPTVAIDGDTKTTTCTAVKVTGHPITGCSCVGPTLKSSSKDLADNSPVEYDWKIEGCTAGEGDELSYAWNGTGISGTGASVTASYTEIGAYTASAVVSNADGMTANVVCSNKAAVENGGWNFKCSALNSSSVNLDVDNFGNVSPGSCMELNKTNSNALQFGSWWCDGSPMTVHLRDCNGDEQVFSHPCNGFVTVQTGGPCKVYFYSDKEFTFKMQAW